MSLRKLLLTTLYLQSVLLLASGQDNSTSKPNAGQPVFSYQEVMVPMRDGVRLQTAILSPAGRNEPLPILLQRTPYGIPDKAPLYYQADPYVISTWWQQKAR